jgi:hypothetical protein
MYLWHNIQAPSYNSCCIGSGCGGKNKCYIFWVRVCSLGYPACNAHVLYYVVIYGPPACTNFTVLSKKRHDFLLKNCWTEQDSIRNICLSSCKIHFYSRLILIKHELSGHFKIKFHENSPVGAELFDTDRQTDRHDEANCRFFAILRTGLKVLLVAQCFYGQFTSPAIIQIIVFFLIFSNWFALFSHVNVNYALKQGHASSAAGILYTCIGQE